MLAVAGTYQNGQLKLEQEFIAIKPVNVIVTFLEDVQPTHRKRLSLDDFSFKESEQLLKKYDFSFSDALIEERRGDEL